MHSKYAILSEAAAQDSFRRVFGCDLPAPRAATVNDHGETAGYTQRYADSDHAQQRATYFANQL